MKILSQIIDDCKDNQKPDYDELRYAVIALSSLVFFDNKDLKSITKDTNETILKLKKDNSSERYHKALNMSPKEWVGWNDDPENPEYQKFRAIGKRLFDKIEKKLKNGESVE